MDALARGRGARRRWPLLAPAPAAAQRTFKQKDCLECHKKAADKFDGLKYVHSAVKQRKCEDCHLRHGAVPKLALKEQGNELCYKCHDKPEIGLDKPNVHAVLRTGSCALCHDPHGSNSAHMLKAGGAEACYTCHDRKGFERKVVHAAMARTAAAPATWPTPPTRRTCSSPTR